MDDKGSLTKRYSYSVLKFAVILNQFMFVLSFVGFYLP